MGWDADILIYIQENIRSEFLDPIMKFITHTNNAGILVIAVCAVLILIRKTRGIGIMSTASLTVEFLVNNLVIKKLVARARPYDTIDGLINIIEKQPDYSFPSGHTGSAFSLVFVLLLVAMFGLIQKNGDSFSHVKPGTAYKIFTIVFTVYSLILGFSRLYVGVHYPTDVLGGMALGLITSILSYLIYGMLIKKIHLSKKN